MTTMLYPIFTGDTQLFKSLVYDIDGVTSVTPLGCTISIWDEAEETIVDEAAGEVGAGYAQYNWGGSVTPGRYTALLTVTISVGVIKSEAYSLRVQEKPPVLG
jgi:hypothetical protein